MRSIFNDFFYLIPFAQATKFSVNIEKNIFFDSLLTQDTNNNKKQRKRSSVMCNIYSKKENKK